jgi:hypothetical protein
LSKIVERASQMHPFHTPMQLSEIILFGGPPERAGIVLPPLDAGKSRNSGTGVATHRLRASLSSAGDRHQHG